MSRRKKHRERARKLFRREEILSRTDDGKVLAYVLSASEIADLKARSKAAIRSRPMEKDHAR